ncbi:MAG: ArsR/SmtB family transcription factor [Bacillota bacterium]
MDDFLIKLKAMADETRLNILKLLLEKNFCVKALAKKLEVSESAISQQLKILREADLVMGEKKGYFVHYRVKKENILNLAEDIKGIINNSDGEFHSK